MRIQTPDETAGQTDGQTAGQTNALILRLTEGLQPVRPLRLSRGLGGVVIGLGATLMVVAVAFGVRPDLVAGRFDPLLLLATGLFLLLGLASSVTVLIMGSPSVGNDHGGWVWAAAMAALLPLAAAMVALGRGGESLTWAATEHGLACLMTGAGLGVLSFAILTGWLRRGAPTSPDRAGLLTGIAAGSFGIFAFSCHCPDDDIVHIGLWHGLAVVLCALLGRIIVPRLIRW